MPPVSAADLALPPPAETSVDVAARVAAARTIQRERLAELDRKGKSPEVGVIRPAGLLSDLACGWSKLRLRTRTSSNLQ